MAREAIFIGYRRDDTGDVAGRIFDALETRFGRARLFKDVDNIPPGADFGEYIKSILPRCRVALILIGPHWAEAKDASGRRRLDDPHDWVRIEIETALATDGLQLVPVLINGAQMPRAEDLPASLQPLLRRNAAVIRRDPDFREDLHKLSQALRTSLRTGTLDLANLGSERKDFTRSRTDMPGWVLPTGAVVAAALALLAWSPWRHSTPPETITPSAAGQEFDDCNGAGWCPRMVTISAGSFTMGSPDSEIGHSPAESPQHVVSINRFAADKFDVTFDQWAACVSRGGCADNPNPDDHGFGRGNHPVINVSWNDAQQYVQWLSQATGQRYRLLSEAEWEYAARAGTTTAYFTGNSISESQANINSGEEAGRTQPVGAYPANAFGLYDMASNVWQWVEDCYHQDYSGAPTDGSAWVDGDCSHRVVRGGSWLSPAEYRRSAGRLFDDPTDRDYSNGFRVARNA